jgi:hypothetical protein
MNPSNDVFGLGVVDSNDVVHFKKLTDDEVGRMVYQALIRAFGKRKPKFVVFETVIKSQIKRLIKEVILMMKGKNE